MSRYTVASMCCIASALAALPAALAAQGDVEELGRVRGGARPPAGYYALKARDPTAFEFSRDNGWIRRARTVAARREALRAQAAGIALTPLAHFDSTGVLRGELRVPVFLILYANTDSATIVNTLPQSVMEARLYGTAPAPPYSIYSYYRELSNDQLTVSGMVLGWTRVSRNDTAYEGSCNGLSCGDVAGLIRELVQAHDATVDFGQFDNDGPDGIPNSSDDDGLVDAVVLIHPELDGSCKNVDPSSAANIWAHSWSYASRTGTTLATGDVSYANGSVVRVNDYIIQGGQGGNAGCSAGEPLAMGLVAHETGHLLGLPDLYDVSGNSAGIGRWGLMGSGNWYEPHRPAHMEAWSRAQLGWVMEVPLAADTSLQIAPVEVGDTTYVVPIPGSSEYFLLENRQQIGSDVALVQPGLLIWHVDPVRINARWGSNRVNATLPHGLSLEQADGVGHLQSVRGNRGDAGDPYPGATGNHALGICTSPSSASNDGAIADLAVDSVYQVVGSLAVTARVRYLTPPPLAVTAAAPPVATMGASYQTQLAATGGSGSCTYQWMFWGGALPRGVSLSAAGVLAGLPEETGTFSFTARLTSGAQTVDAPLQLTVVAPVLAVGDLVAHLVGTTAQLSVEQIKYLDLLGNNNGRFDVGDFLAWVEETQASLSASVMADVLRHGPGGDPR